MKLRYFKAARKVAQLSQSRFRVGAALVRGHNVISVGCNEQKRSHIDIMRLADEEYRYIVGIHAEYSALKGLRPYDIGSRADLYVFRLRRDNNQPGMAKPCRICEEILRRKGIRRVYYTIGKNEYGRLDL